VLEKKILHLQKNILADGRFIGIPSIEKRRNNFYFHAKDNYEEIREHFFTLLQQLEFRAYIIVARKIEAIFQNKHNSKPEVFYDAMVSQLFTNQLVDDEQNIISFERRGKNNKEKILETSIKEAIPSDYQFTVMVQNCIEQPCLSVIDYVNRAIQRMYIQGEAKYYNLIKEKVHLIWDIYDYSKKPDNRYTQKSNPFDIAKISPIKTTTKLNS
jgi:hypothetical protein